MLKSLFRWRVILVGLLLLLVPAALAQETDLCEDAELIDYNDTYEGEINDDFPFYVFCFEGEEDDDIAITVATTNGDLVPSVFLANPLVEEDEDIEVFADNTARDEDEEAEINLVLPDDAVYIIIVSREDTSEGDTEGEFEMSLEVANSSRNNTNSTDIENFCDEEPVATLSKYQYGIPSSNPDAPLLAYNVGCTGFLVSTIAGRSEIAEYEIDRRGEMSFSIGDTEFITIDANEDEWEIEIVDGDPLLLERLEDDGCDEEPLEELISGAWLGEDNLVLDFTCNGVIIVSAGGETIVGSYELERSDISVSLETGDFVLEDFELDSDALNAEIDGDAVELENVLD